MSTRPRIRSLKPEMWQDEKIGNVSRDARLLFTGLITLADDEGRFRALPSIIVGHVFPYDEDATRRLKLWLSELVDAGLVVLYEAGGTRYGWLPQFTQHQRINRPTPSLLPDPSRSPHEQITEESVNGHGGIMDASLPRARGGDRIGSG